MAGPAPKGVRVQLVLGETRIRAGRLKAGEVRLRRFQEEVLEALEGRARLVTVEAPTGSGKTIIPLLPLILYEADADRAYSSFDLESRPWHSASLYPSRALLDDQEVNIHGLLERLCAKPLNPGFLSQSGADTTTRLILESVFVPVEESSEEGEERPLASLYETPSGAIVALLRVHSRSLGAVRSRLEELLGDDKVPTRLDILHTLYSVLTRMHKASRPVFTVTLSTLEYLSLLLEGAYGPGSGERIASLIGSLAQEADNLESIVDRILGLSYKDLAGLGWRHKVFAAGYRVLGLYSDLLFVDEAHLYTGPSLASIVALLALYLALVPSGRVVLSSATHNRRVLDSLALAARELAGVEPVTVREPGTQGEVIVRKRTRLHVVGVTRGTGRTNRLLDNIRAQRYLPGAVQRLAGEIRGLGAERVLIVGDRLYYLWRSAGIAKKAIGGPVSCIDSLSRRGLGPSVCEEPDPRRAKVLVGSSAISYGIDIPGIDVAIVYGKTPASIIQRIGRTGRRPGQGLDEAVVYLVTGSVNARILEGYSGRNLSVGELERALEEAIASPPSSTPFLEPLWHARAMALFLAVAAAYVRTLQADALTSAGKVLRRAPEALMKALGMESQGLVMRLLRDMASLAPGTAKSLLMPRPIASLSLEEASSSPLLRLSESGVQVSLAQYLRAKPLCGGAEEYDRYDYFINIDTNTYDKLEKTSKWRLYSSRQLLDIMQRIARTGRQAAAASTVDRLLSLIPGGAASSARRYAALVQVGESSVHKCGLDKLADRLSPESVAVFVPLDSTKEPAAYTLVNYYTAGAIPVVSVDLEEFTGYTPSFADIIESSSRHGVLVVF